MRRTRTIHRSMLATVLSPSTILPAFTGGQTLDCYREVHPARFARQIRTLVIKPERLIARHLPAVHKTVARHH